MQRLLEWALEQGAEVRANANPDNHRELAASRDLHPNDCVMRLPQQLLMHAGLLLEDPLLGEAYRKLREQMGAALDERTALCMLLIWERVKGEASFWHPYLSYLPEQYDDPYWWHPDELQLLVGTRLMKGLQQHEHGLEALQRAMCNLMQFSKEVPPTDNINPHLAQLHSSSWAGNYEAARWSRSVLWSRSFNVHCLGRYGRVAAMIPVLDMLDHDPTAKVVWHTGPDGMEPFHFVIKRRYKKGEVMFNNYGTRKDSEELLLAYGFSLPDNPNDCVLLDVTFQPQNHHNISSKDHVGVNETVQMVQPGELEPQGAGHAAADAEREQGVNDCRMAAERAQAMIDGGVDAEREQGVDDCDVDAERVQGVDDGDVDAERAQDVDDSGVDAEGERLHVKLDALRRRILLQLMRVPEQHVLSIITPVPQSLLDALNIALLPAPGLCRVMEWALASEASQKWAGEVMKGQTQAGMGPSGGERDGGVQVSGTAVGDEVLQLSSTTLTNSGAGRGATRQPGSTVLTGTGGVADGSDVQQAGTTRHMGDVACVKDTVQYPAKTQGMTVTHNGTENLGQDAGTDGHRGSNIASGPKHSGTSSTADSARDSAHDNLTKVPTDLDSTIATRSTNGMHDSAGNVIAMLRDCVECEMRLAEQLQVFTLLREQLTSRLHGMVSDDALYNTGVPHEVGDDCGMQVTAGSLTHDGGMPTTAGMHGSTDATVIAGKVPPADRLGGSKRGREGEMQLANQSGDRKRGREADEQLANEPGRTEQGREEARRAGMGHMLVVEERSQPAHNNLVVPQLQPGDDVVKDGEATGVAAEGDAALDNTQSKKVKITDISCSAANVLSENESQHGVRGSALQCGSGAGKHVVSDTKQRHMDASGVGAGPGDGGGDGLTNDTDAGLKNDSNSAHPGLCDRSQGSSSCKGDVVGTISAWSYSHAMCDVGPDVRARHREMAVRYVSQQKKILMGALEAVSARIGDVLLQATKRCIDESGREFEREEAVTTSWQNVDGGYMHGNLAERAGEVHTWGLWVQEDIPAKRLLLQLPRSCLLTSTNRRQLQSTLMACWLRTTYLSACQPDAFDNHTQNLTQLVESLDASGLDEVPDPLAIQFLEKLVREVTIPLHAELALGNVQLAALIQGTPVEARLMEEALGLGSAVCDFMGHMVQDVHLARAWAWSEWVLSHVASRVRVCGRDSWVLAPTLHRVPQGIQSAALHVSLDGHQHDLQVFSQCDLKAGTCLGHQVSAISLDPEACLALYGGTSMRTWAPLTDTTQVNAASAAQTNAPTTAQREQSSAIVTGAQRSNEEKACALSESDNAAKTLLAGSKHGQAVRQNLGNVSLELDVLPPEDESQLTKLRLLYAAGIGGQHHLAPSTGLAMVAAAFAICLYSPRQADSPEALECLQLWDKADKDPGCTLQLFLAQGKLFRQLTHGSSKLYKKACSQLMKTMKAQLSDLPALPPTLAEHGRNPRSRYATVGSQPVEPAVDGLRLYVSRVQQSIKKLISDVKMLKD